MVRTEKFYFLSSNQGTKIHAKKWIPENGNYRGILQIHHGMVEYIDRYDEFATFMAKQGFLVVGHDHAGHGASAKTEDDFGYFGYGATKHPSDVLVDDMQKLRLLIQEQENASLPYFILGHSMGSYMLRKYLTVYADDKLTGAIIVGTGDVDLFSAKAALCMTHMMKIILGERYRSRFVRNLTYTKPYHEYDLTNKDLSRSWLSTNVESVKDYLSKPQCTFIFTLNGYQGLFEAVIHSREEKHLCKIPKHLKLLFAAGDKDPVGDMGKGVQRVYERFCKLGMRKVDLKLYPNDRHEILNELDRHVVYHDILDWLTKAINE